MIIYVWYWMIQIFFQIQKLQKLQKGNEDNSTCVNMV